MLTIPPASLFLSGLGYSQHHALVWNRICPINDAMSSPLSPPALAATQPSASVHDLERAVGQLRLAVVRDGGRNVIGDLHQAGCGRMLFPARVATAPLEAVIVNTAGGLTGGDRFDVTARIGAGADAGLTTQACEKVYQAALGPAGMSTRLKLGSGARLRWLPQETILFDKSALTRSLTIDMADNADVLAAEAILLGRQAMGEALHTARLSDRWRIRRDGRLIFAEETAVNGAKPGEWAALRGSKAALGETTTALATIVHASPKATGKLDGVRAIMNRTEIDGGASAFDGLLVMRILAPSGLVLRRTLVELLEYCAGQPLPRVWMT
jgi:urease accessory protein